MVLNFRISAFILGLFIHVTAQAQNCNESHNPHSFGCAELSFIGSLFPMTDVSMGRMSGSWRLLTYSPLGGRPGPEFAMAVAPHNPRIPEGVINNLDGSMAGQLDFSRGIIAFHNWGEQGRSIFQEPGRTRFLDRNTVQIIFTQGHDRQSLQCRIFDRQGSEHLQCRWSTLRAGQGRFILRGYLGFLRH